MTKQQAVQMDVTVPTSEVHVDEYGNLVIKNKELAEKMQKFLASDEGRKIARAEYFLLCCKLKPPKLPQKK
jgi:hypothetical protein